MLVYVTPSRKVSVVEVMIVVIHTKKVLAVVVGEAVAVVVIVLVLAQEFVTPSKKGNAIVELSVAFLMKESLLVLAVVVLVWPHLEV